MVYIHCFLPKGRTMSTEKTFVMDQLDDVTDLKLFGHTRNVYRTSSIAAMLEAQRILENAGYTLEIYGTKMIEGVFYQLAYSNDDEGRRNPAWVTLQYDTQRLLAWVPLALFYMTYDADGRHVKRWGTPFDITDVADTPDAARMMARFEQSIEDSSTRSHPVWVPVFDNKQGYV